MQLLAWALTTTLSFNLAADETRAPAPSTAVERAVALLGTIGLTDIPPVQLVEPAPNTTFIERQAFTRKGDPNIYLVRTARLYKKALKGDVRLLAGVLAHERAHILGGDEVAAYTEQLRVLDLLKVRGYWRDNVVKLKQAFESMAVRRNVKK